ncbi:MAG: hypothetical protein ACRDSF_16860 [Pseudonocardiaceae bacterium]
MHLIEQGEGGDETQERFVGPGGITPLRGGSEVVTLLFEALQPRGAAGQGQLRLGPFRQGEEEIPMAFPGRVALSRAHQLSPGEVPDRLEQAVTALRLVDVSLDEGLVHQAGEDIQHRVAIHDLAGADALGRIEGETAGEHRQAAQQRALGIVEQLVAPCHRGLERLLAGQRGPAPAGEEAEPVVEGRGDPSRGHHANPGGGQLDGQGQTVEAPADLPHYLGVVALYGESRPHEGGPLHEQPRPGLVVE